MPTVCDYFGVADRARDPRRVVAAVLEENAPAQRRAALYGWFGQTVNVTDGTLYLFPRARPRGKPAAATATFSRPASFSMRDVCPLDFYDEAELGHFLPYTDYPVIRARAHMPAARIGRRRCSTT